MTLNIERIENDGKIDENVKAAVLNEDLRRDLMKIQSQYKCLIDLIDKCESRTYSINKAYIDIQGTDFGDDTCRIKQYLQKRFEKNEIISIIEMDNEDISPEVYAFLLQCPSTSVEVERSFSMLKKLLAKDRTFRDDNIKYYRPVILIKSETLRY